jgi:3-oxoacyl-[acyl-carrier protein] reductase
VDLQIRGKKAMLAGGSAGMGRATAERLAEAGAELVLSARGEERLNKAAHEIAQRHSVNVTPVVADSATHAGREALFRACPDPDILVITIKPPDPNGDFLQVTPEMWRASVETALINCTAGVSREIARHGVVLNNILPGMFATEGAAEIMGAYADAFGLPRDPKTVLEHFTDHNHIPAGFVGKADDMAPMAALLCSPLARFIVGQNIVIDGGQHVALF